MKTFARLALGVTALALSATTAFAQAADWQKQVSRIIASKQTYPRTAQMRGEEGTARVKVYIGAGGAIERTELVSASGSTSLDKEALAMPTRAGTVPPPPGGATAVIVPFTWKLM
ncbi:TonB-like protein [Novosphingobium aromaticivorans DSM 12444]|jgi:periplasmic protein TonB|uniref:TonB-like protein n=1 Tax=Novosphingobium aromaticivorans (strain ATCC 700278 / DSM 12444 / CCUG 56034 / CIP 105152 / NBRC 16084 / F199) TaxID=279238 RepID=Q2G4G5_NOVAD|nr:TonB family protein [Novosphingobium aromaticivorans]ABD27258.1 TonB-like protein [Novosphingobium aromaticivorans DSM 12444]SCY65700.1 protein TonB [Novosphingobium aromaticivorans]